MKKLVFEKAKCKSYMDFYAKICKDLNLKGLAKIDDIATIENLDYNPDLLYEFLWYNFQKDLAFEFVGYDREAVREPKTVEDYMWNLIFEAVEHLVCEYPNCTLKFVNKT